VILSYCDHGTGVVSGIGVVIERNEVVVASCHRVPALRAITSRMLGSCHVREHT